MSGLRIDLGQHSDAGRQPVNQDFHGACVPGEPWLGSKGIAVALADGIGSSATSQLASAAAVRGFLDDYYSTSEAWPVRRAAQRVLEATNSWLHAQTLRSDARFDADRGHVCTFSALVFKGREAHLLHVGDARIYRLHAHALEQLSEDHRVRVSAQESYLGRALGASPTVEIDYLSWTTEAGEIYLLATDGLHDHLGAADVHAALAAHPQALDAAAAQVVAGALARGASDNLTLQIVRVVSLPDAAAQRLHLQREHLAMPPPLRPRSVFEGYTIVRELKASARSHIHLAVDQASGQQVVLKTPSVDLREHADYLDRFLLEEWVARRIDHPNVLKPCAQERARQHLFVALEYVDGQTLTQWMTDHPRPDLGSVRRIVEQVAEGAAGLSPQGNAAPGPAPGQRDDRCQRHGEDHRLRRRARRRPQRRRARARRRRHPWRLAVHRARVLHRRRGLGAVRPVFTRCDGLPDAERPPALRPAGVAGARRRRPAQAALRTGAQQPARPAAPGSTRCCARPCIHSAPSATRPPRPSCTTSAGRARST